MKKGWAWIAALFSALAAVGVVYNKMKKLPNIHRHEGHAVTVIGGADGPAAIFVATRARPSLWRTVWVHGCIAVSRFAQARVRWNRRRAARKTR